MKKITTLSHSQERDLIEYIDRWRNIALDPNGDVSLAAHAVKQLYNNNQLREPMVFLAQSPLQGALFVAALDQLLDNLGGQIWDQLRENLLNSLLDQLLDNLGGQIWDQLRENLLNSLRDQLGDQLGHLRDSLLDQLGDQLGHLRDQLSSVTLPYFYGVYGLYWICFYDFPRVIGATYTPVEDAALSLHQIIGANCGFWWGYRNVAVITQKPTEIHWNSRAQLHHDGGMAVRFSDGTGLWALNGVRVTQHIAETPAMKLDPILISTEHNAQVRAEIVRKIGVERVCQKLGSRTVDSATIRIGDQEHQYELIELPAVHANSFCPYLKMRNPSVPDLFHVEGVSPECRTVAQAIAWRNQEPEGSLPLELS